jgi:hypothetical protein
MERSPLSITYLTRCSVPTSAQETASHVETFAEEVRFRSHRPANKLTTTWDDTVHIEIVEGRLRVKDQIKEYIDRGDALENWGYLDYFLGTYDGKILEPSTHGRAPSSRVPYQEGSNRPGHCRVIRSGNHETMPYFPGQWFPKRQSTALGGLYEASMLALLRPWRSILDIKREDETFRDAFDAFMSDAPQSTQAVVENIQFFHECSDSAAAQRNANEENTGVGDDTELVDDETHPSTTNDRAPENDPFDSMITEEKIQLVLDKPFSSRELLYADVAVDIGLETGALSEQKYSVAYQRPAVRASTDQMILFRSWESDLAKLAQDTEKDLERSSTPDAVSAPLCEGPSHVALHVVEPASSCVVQEPSPAAAVDWA